MTIAGCADQPQSLQSIKTLISMCSCCAHLALYAFIRCIAFIRLELGAWDESRRLDGIPPAMSGAQQLQSALPGATCKKWPVLVLQSSKLRALQYIWFNMATYDTGEDDVDAHLSHNARVDGLDGHFLTSQVESLHQWLEMINLNLQLRTSEKRWNPVLSIDNPWS